MISSFRKHYIKFKEVKILWGPGVGDRISQRPAQPKSLISIFQEFSSSINKTFILAGRLGTRLSFYEV